MNDRSRRLLKATMSFGLGLCLLGLSACAPASKQTDSAILTLADSYAPTHVFAEAGVSVFMDEVSSVTDIEYFPAGQMGTPRDLASLTRSGVIDIGPASPAYLSDQLPLSSVSDLPGLVDDSCVGANALFDMLTPGGILYEEEYAPRGLRPLWVSVLPSYEILTVGRLVNSPDDLRGLNIRTSGGALDGTLDALGAAAVSMPASEAYEALSRKTVDGVAFPFISVLPYKLQEVLRYSTTGINIGAFALPYVISESTWKKLSPSLREQIEAAGRNAQASLCAAVNEQTPAAITTIKASGVEFTTPDKAGMADFEQRLEPVRQQWADNMDSIGKPGTEVLRTYERNLARYEGNAT